MNCNIQTQIVGGLLLLLVITSGCHSTSHPTRNPSQSFELVVGSIVTQQEIEAHLDQVAYVSRPARFKEWAEGNAEKFALTREAALNSVAEQLADQILPCGTR